VKSEEFATAIVVRRIVLTCVLLWSVLANSSLFTLHSSLHAQTQHGIASFYAKRATGSRTANGEWLHHDSMTCAHRTHPFGTHLLVTHQGNGRSVVVRVNDRGPFVRGRIVDLSWGAARELGMIGEGIAQVVVMPVDDDITIPLRPTHEYRIDLPKLEIDSIQLKDTLRAIWQEELLIDHKEVQRHMEGTARKSFIDRLQELFRVKSEK